MRLPYPFNNMIGNFTDSSSFFKSIGSRLMDFDDPVMMAIAGLVVVLVFLWLFWSVRETSVARQRLNHLNKALSEDASYGLGSLITQLGEETRPNEYTKSFGNYGSPSPNSAMNWSPPAEEEIGFSGITEKDITEDEKANEDFGPAETKEPFVLKLESLEKDESAIPKEKK